MRAGSAGEGASSQGCKLAGGCAERHAWVAPRQPPAATRRAWSRSSLRDGKPGEEQAGGWVKQTRTQALLQLANSLCLPITAG